MTTDKHNIENQPLAGKLAVVTGASTGIGRAIAIQLVRAGADLFLHARSNQQGLDETISLACQATQLIGRPTELAFGQALVDLESVAGHTQLVEAAFEWSPSIDIWVNNAGADVLTGELARRSFAEKLELLWRVDVNGTIAVSRLVGQRMKLEGSGCIVNIGWDQAATGMAGDSGQMFAAAKGAVMSFTRSLAKSLAPQVRVNCVAPGWIKTEWGATASPEWDARARRESLLGHWGRPEDVAAAVHFLTLPSSTFINAQVIEVNGGFSGAELL